MRCILRDADEQRAKILKHGRDAIVPAIVGSSHDKKRVRKHRTDQICIRIVQLIESPAAMSVMIRVEP